ncbi:ATP synthase subunit C lysine N-methyltransferase isoform X7 [Bubalus kerabau]|uniref:ATP synthase subunit C lysine N-methyltransferase isoform X7 n=2 Tax=Bubalus carabanensis TaxID=3119969 RepID=UPI00244E7092|nr:ATP synthase subunit C lysine N-methyltransferase isoform X7 [Bubalus carabanensis]
MEEEVRPAAGGGRRAAGSFGARARRRARRGTRGTHLATLEEGRPSECVPPASLEANSLKKNSWGVLFTGIVGGTLVAVYAVATPFVTPALRRICLPFVPATTKQIENVVKMLQCRRGSLVDIGSGDGRIVIAAAKEGFTAVGYELNPWLVWYSRYRAWQEGVQGSARFYISDLWKVTFSQYSNVVIFGVPQMGSNTTSSNQLTHRTHKASSVALHCLHGELLDSQ